MPESRPESPVARATPGCGLAREAASILCPVQRVNVQKSLRPPDLLLARLLRCDAFVARRAVDRHVTAIAAGEHTNELLGHVTIAVNEPAGVATLPQSRAVYAVASNVRRLRCVDIEHAKGSLSFQERATAVAPPGLPGVAEQPRSRVAGARAIRWLTLDRSPPRGASCV